MQASNTQPTSTPQANKKWSWKTISTVVGLALFFTGAMVVVLIVQRQRAVEGPVAPTAPVSEPAASETVTTPATCAVTFTISTPTGVSCTNKIAYATALTTAQLSQTNTTGFPAPLTTINPDTEYFYVISVTATGPTTEDVVVVDTLPAGVTFVAAAGSTGVTANTAKTEVTHSFGKFDSAGTKRVQFKVKAAPTATGALSNTVALKLGTAAAVPAPSCTNSISVAVPGAISCTSKKAYTNFFTGITTAKGEPIAEDSMIAAGTEFVYSITVAATAATTQNVIVTDVLPVGVSYVGKRTGDTQVQTYVAATRTLTVDLGKFEAGSLTKTVEFKVKAAEDIAAGTFTNTANVNFTGGTVATADSCSIALVSPPKGTAVCEYKRALTNFSSKNGVAISNATITPGDTVVYQIKINAPEQTTGAVQVVDTLPEGMEFVVDPDNTEGLTVSQNKRVISLDLGILGTAANNRSTTIEFKAKSAATVTSALVNTAEVTTGTSTTPSRCEQSLAVQAVGVPDPVECNESCTYNSDCSNDNHICATTADGTLRCRLENYPSAADCRAPGIPAVPAPASPVIPPTQPALPEELPLAGPEDWTNWLKAGLVTLGVGAILLLLL
jgi:uncharacterized repeat protein (TIGR01451 family)